MTAPDKRDRSAPDGVAPSDRTLPEAVRHSPAGRALLLADVQARIGRNREELRDSLQRLEPPVRAIERAGRRVIAWWPGWPAALALLAAIWLCRRLLRRPMLPGQARQRQGWSSWLQQALALWQMARQLRALVSAATAPPRLPTPPSSRIPAAIPTATRAEINRWDSDGGQGSTTATGPPGDRTAPRGPDQPVPRN